MLAGGIEGVARDRVGGNSQEVLGSRSRMRVAFSQ